jgi:hypothetical protein
VVEPALLVDSTPVPIRVILDASRQLEERGLVRREGARLTLTESGGRTASALAQAREESLSELLGDWWGPDRPTDLVQLVRDLNSELCGSDGDRPRSPEPPRDHAA